MQEPPNWSPCTFSCSSANSCLNRAATVILKNCKSDHVVDFSLTLLKILHQLLFALLKKTKILFHGLLGPARSGSSLFSFKPCSLWFLNPSPALSWQSAFTDPLSYPGQLLLVPRDLVNTTLSSTSPCK